MTRLKGEWASHRYLLFPTVRSGTGIYFRLSETHIRHRKTRSQNSDIPHLQKQVRDEPKKKVIFAYTLLPFGITRGSFSPPARVT